MMASQMQAMDNGFRPSQKSLETVISSYPRDSQGGGHQDSRGFVRPELDNVVQVTTSPNDATQSRPTAQNAATYKVSSIDPIESLNDFTYVLDPVGQLLYASSAVESLFGYTVDDVVGRNIIEFIHSDDVEAFVAAFNDSILLRSDFFHYHRLRCRTGAFVILETTGHAVYNENVLAQDTEGNLVPACKFFVLSARNYPSNAIKAFDKLLDIKLGNEQLKAELRELGEDETILESSSLRDALNLMDGNGNAAFGRLSSTDNKGQSSRGSRLSGPLPTSPMNNYGARGFHSRGSKTSDGVTPSSRQVRNPRLESRSLSTPAKLSRDEPTGLISPPNEVDPNGKKGRKAKVAAEQHTCSDCKTTDSPEWRKGPKGPKTLCNACGLRYSKKQKKHELFVQEQHKQHDTTTPAYSDSIYEDHDLVPGTSGSVTPNDVVRPMLSRGFSVPGGARPWSNPQSGSRHQFSDHAVEQYRPDGQYWPT